NFSPDRQTLPKPTPVAKLPNRKRGEKCRKLRLPVLKDRVVVACSGWSNLPAIKFPEPRFLYSGIAPTRRSTGFGRSKLATASPRNRRRPLQPRGLARGLRASPKRSSVQASPERSGGLAVSDGVVKACQRISPAPITKKLSARL